MALPTPSPLYRSQMERVLTTRYFDGWDRNYMSSDQGKADLEEHLSGRMTEFDSIVLPWIKECFDLGGKSVLEIGCGTGSSTVAMAFATGSIRAFDIDSSSLAVARERAALLGATNVEIRELDPQWAASSERAMAFADKEGSFDVVLFIALLEHLTPSERIHALRAAWRSLKSDGILVVYETPNRLGCFDWHSFRLPFFHALPDELAVEYSNRSDRTGFAINREGNVVENLYRLGRGVSFHEFDIALGIDHFRVLSDGYSPWLAHRGALAHPAYDAALEGLFEKYLPKVPLGFSRPSLDLVLQKAAPDDRRHRATPARHEVDVLRDQLHTYERQFGSQTDLTLQLLRVVAGNLRETAQHPARIPGRLQGWWRRRMLGR